MQITPHLFKCGQLKRRSDKGHARSNTLQINTNFSVCLFAPGVSYFPFFFLKGPKQTGARRAKDDGAVLFSRCQAWKCVPGAMWTAAAASVPPILGVWLSVRLVKHTPSQMNWRPPPPQVRPDV